MKQSVSEVPPPPCWLFVDATADFGGHEVMLLQWLRMLQAQGRVAPRLLARAGSRLHASVPPGLATEAAFAARSAGSRRPSRVADAATLARALRAERPRLCVFACGCLSAQAALVTQSRLMGMASWVYVPLVEPFEAMGFRAGRWQDRLLRWAYGRVPDGWITLSAAQAAQFQGWARPRGPVLTLPNTIDACFEDARPDPAPARPPGALRLLVLGRLDAHHKGLDLLLDHLARSPPAERAGLRIRVVGEGPDAASLRSRIERSTALSACVALAGWSPAHEAMAAHDVLLLPSRYEGVPLVMLEAMALGLPVVASDLPGTRSHLPADCLFSVGDIGAALRIARRFALPDERARVARRNREHVERHAGRAAFANAVARLTGELDAAGRGRVPAVPSRRHRTGAPPP
ncbi:MAG TPA: glycosyltransferase family 4 protein [Methylibium sp.]|nr:glycosyltransferase family 4 protein [Methylibium sp.]